MKLPISDFRFQIGAAPRGCGSFEIANRKSQIANPAAFSLVEILVVTGLLSVIILGLVAMFGQTQRAFRTGMTQIDVLESGRMSTDLIRRELEQATPSYQGAFNFYAWLPSDAPLVQPMPGSSFPRTNLLEEMFFLTRRNQEWIGIGYFVRTSNPTNGFLEMPLVGTPPTTVGVGTLYRFETNAPVLSGRVPAQMYSEFRAATLDESRVSKIMDGVIHFRVRAFDTNGVWITDHITNNTIRVVETIWSPVAPGEVGQYIFYSNAVPASVELEIGILEDRAWERFKSLPDPGSQLRYITNQAGRVHLFRQRIPIRNVDPAAYQ
jgi:hypothetical protein